MHTTRSLIPNYIKQIQRLLQRCRNPKTQKKSHVLEVNIRSQVATFALFASDDLILPDLGESHSVPTVVRLYLEDM